MDLSNSCRRIGTISLEHFPISGRIAAVDFGTKRIGLAICDPEWILASPLDVYLTRGVDADTTYFTGLARCESVSAFVVGLPIHCDGRESQKSLQSREFARWLEVVTERPVRLFDERFTTAEARQRIQPKKGKKRSDQRPVDAIAALVLLESFLEACRYRGEVAGFPVDSLAGGGEPLDEPA